jgi:hypothetical protein
MYLSSDQPVAEITAWLRGYGVFLIMGFYVIAGKIKYFLVFMVEKWQM